MDKSVPRIPGTSAAAEESILGPFRDRIWVPFLDAVRRYELISPGDRIAVCVSGGKDSMLLAKLMQMLARDGETPFEAVFQSMDPGYSPANRAKLEENAALLGIPLRIFETNVFDVANRQEHSPCYLCAKMRRGHLYAQAKEAGCGKIALGHHRNDVVETTVMAMFYGSQLQGMIPKLRSTNFEGMELIRPLYRIREDDIIAWSRANGLEFLQCSCRFTEQAEDGGGRESSKRREIKELLRELGRVHPDVEENVFRAVHAVEFDTFPGWKTEGVRHLFTEAVREPEDS